MLDVTRDIHVLRDPTRGGLAAALNEIADQSQVGMRITEAALPLRPEVLAACELLGLDPLYVANEGKLIAIVPERTPMLWSPPCAHIRSGRTRRLSAKSSRIHITSSSCAPRLAVTVWWTG